MAQSFDPTSLVSHLSNNLAIIFAASGLYDLSSTSLLRRIQLKTTGIPLPGASLINMSYIRSERDMGSPKQSGKRKHHNNPNFDSRGVIRTFKDLGRAEIIRLERLSLCPLGITKRVRQKGYPQLSEAYSVSKF